MTTAIQVVGVLLVLGIFGIIIRDIRQEVLAARARRRANWRRPR